MQTEQIPLSLLGVKGFKYTKNDFSNVVYDPVQQVGENLFAAQGDRDTVSDCSTTSGIPLFETHDDEERDVDD